MFLKKTVFKTLNLIEINKERVLENYDLIKRKTEKYEIWPVLKANAYGHGISQIASILNKRDFKYFVVDSYFEALEIKKVSRKEVLLIGSIDPVNFKLMNFKGIALMIQDAESIEELGRLGKKVKIHLKINTGMNRQGFDLGELEKVCNILNKYKKIEIEGVFSHLADSDNQDESFTRQQERRFELALDKIYGFGFMPKYVHLSATFGVLKINNPKINIVRLGIGLYGFGTLKGLRPVLRMKSVFTKVREIGKGEKVGYSCNFMTDKETRIGVVPVGYYEFFDRRLSNCGWVKYKKRFFQIAGNVCMNLLMINLKDQKADEFEEVEVVSWDSEDKNSVLNMAKICRTIPYEILVRFNGTIRRVIV